MSNEDHRKFVTGTKSHQVNTINEVSFLTATRFLSLCPGYSLFFLRQVRLYDVSAQRRPVMSFDFHETAITAITEDPDGHTVYVGNASADLAAFDIRTGWLIDSLYKRTIVKQCCCIEKVINQSIISVAGKLLGSFLGKCSGSIRSVVRHPHHQVIASCGKMLSVAHNFKIHMRFSNLMCVLFYWLVQG